MWHCPHCGAPQAETARCWVCRRSSTTCSTCRHFRASLATDLGYCALDRKRLPLTGRELRGCWSQPATPGEVQRAAGASSGPRAPEPTAPRGFVPLEELGLRGGPAIESPVSPFADAPVPEAFLMTEPLEGWEARPNLFGDLER
jgi:hypothetical protein